jgi:putative FmdB family regulatory protein
MPIYEYLCEKCEREFEVEQRITADPLKTCPHCRSRRIKKLISQTSFVLKGGGWYSDLYSSSSPKPESSETTSADSSEGSSGGDSDKKKSKEKSKEKSGKGDKKKGGKAAA